MTLPARFPKQPLAIRSAISTIVVIAGLSSALQSTALRSAESLPQNVTDIAMPAESTANDAAILFRRIFVAADRVHEFTDGSERLLPVARDEFELLVGSGRENSPTTPRIERASYHVELDGSRLVNGSAELQVVHEGGGPEWLDLKSAGFAAHGFQWADDRLCLAGTYHAEQAGEATSGVIVSASGTLRFSWTARSRQASDGAEFNLLFPRAGVSAFSLVAPAPVRVSTAGWTEVNLSKSANGAHRHEMAVRGGTPLVFRVHTPVEEPASSAFTLRQATTYAVAPSGTLAESRLRITPLDSLTTGLTLQCDAGMEVVEVTLGGRPLDFRREETAGGDAYQSIAVALGRPLPPGETELRVRAVAATDIDANMDLRPFRLDRSAWLGGTVQINLDDGLRVQELRYDGLQPVPSERSGSPERVQWLFAQAMPQAKLSLRVAPAPNRLRGQSLTTATVDRGEINATAVFFLASDYGAEGVLHAELEPEWQISSVESEPAGVVRSWATENGGGAQSLIVVLDQPVAPQAPVRLRIVAQRRRNDAESSLPAKRLVILRFSQFDAMEHWIEVAPVPSLAMTRHGADPVFAATKDDAPDVLREFVSDQRDRFLFVADERVEHTFFQLHARSADVSGDVEVRAHVSESTVQYRCRILVEPLSSEVKQVGVVFSAPLDELPQWRFVDSSGSEITAERSSLTSETGEAIDEGPYRIIRWTLVRPQVQPFELEVAFERQRHAASPMILAAIEMSRSQSGLVYVSGDRSLRLTLENRGLEPSPIGEELAAEAESLREDIYSYHYQPEQAILADKDPPLLIRRDDTQALSSSVWIRTATLDAAYLPNGQVINCLSLSLENQGADRIEIGLPKAGQILYRVGDDAWLQVASAPGDRTVAIPLARTSGTPKVELRFREARRPLAGTASIGPALLRFSVPVGHVEFHAWLGHEYRVVQLDLPAERLLAGFDAMMGGPEERRGERAQVGSEFAHGMASWKSHIAVADGAASSTLLIVHTRTVRLWCVALLAGGALVAAVLLRIHWKWAFALAVAGLMGSLVAPIAIVPQISAFAWGCSAALLLQGTLVMASSAWRRFARVESERVRKLMATGAALLLCLAGVYSRVVEAAEPTTGGIAPIPRVLDPIETVSGRTEKGTPPVRPAGPYVYVPDSLYASLLERSREQRAPIGEWLVTNCRVRGAITGESAGPFGNVNECTIILDVETFHRDAVIRLPLPSKNAQWRPSGFRLDGASVESSWSQDGGMLHIRAGKPGRHNLELSVTPQVRRSVDATELTLPLPSVASCSLDLSVPAEFPAVTFSGHSGDVQYLASASAYRGNLGSPSNLVISWPTPMPTGRNRATADLLTWLHVARTSTLIEQRLIVHVLGDEPCRLEVVPPPGVRFVPSANELPYAHVSRARRPRNSAQGESEDRIAIVVAAEGSDVLTIPLRFVAENAAAATAIPLPRVAVEGDVEIASRSVAIQAANDVRVALLAGMNAEQIEPEEFMNRWEHADALPDVAYREPAAAHNWRMTIQPEQARIEAAESATAIAHRTGIDVRYRSDCRVQRGALILHRIHVPQDLVVAAVEIWQGDDELPADWTRPEAGELIVFLPEPVSSTHAVSIIGTLPADDDGNVRLELPRLEASQRSEPRLIAARTAGTALAIEESERLRPAPAGPLPADWNDDWQVYGHYALVAMSDDVAPIKVNVRAAGEPSSVHTVLSVLPNQIGWDTSLRCSVRSMHESLDRIVIFAPKQWQRPYQVEPSDRWRLSVQEEERQNRITLRPRQPIGADTVVTVRGQMPRDRQDSVTIPLIRLVEPASRVNLVALARAISGEEVLWLPQNLQPLSADAANDMKSIAGPESDAWQLYRRGDEQEPASARLSVVEPIPSAPHISLMDVAATIGEQQRPFVESCFTLVPRGRRSCDVLLPEGARLLDVRVNGRPQPALQTASRRWQVQLDSSQLPQQIRVTSQGSEDAAADGKVRQVLAPILLVEESLIPVLQTAWQIRSDHNWRHAGGAQAELAPISGAKLAAVRWANLVEKLDDTVPALLRNSAGDWTGWFDDWRGRIRAAQGEYGRREAEVDDAEVAATAAQARQRMAAIEEAIPPSAAESAVQSTDRGDVVGSDVLQGNKAGAHTLRLLGDGRLDAVRLQSLESETDYAAERILGGILLSVIALGVLVPGRRAFPQRSEAWSALQAAALIGLAIAAILSGNLWAILGGLSVALLVVGWGVRCILIQQLPSGSPRS